MLHKIIIFVSLSNIFFSFLPFHRFFSLYLHHNYYLYMIMKRLIIFIAFAFSAILFVQAKIILPQMFQSGMVLQRGNKTAELWICLLRQNSWWSGACSANG